MSEQKMSGNIVLKLKDNLIGFNGKIIKNTNEIAEVQKKYPKLSSAELVEKCPPFVLGEELANMLLSVAAEITPKDPKDIEQVKKSGVDKLKMFRWASKISNKLETGKGELALDQKQATDLFDYATQMTGVSIILQGPILLILEDLVAKLTNDDLK